MVLLRPKFITGFNFFKLPSIWWVNVEFSVLIIPSGVCIPVVKGSNTEIWRETISLHYWWNIGLLYWDIVMQALIQEKASVIPVKNVHTLFTAESMVYLPIYSIRHLPDSFVLSHNLKDNIRNDMKMPSNPCQKQIHH